MRADQGLGTAHQDTREHGRREAEERGPRGGRHPAGTQVPDLAGPPGQRGQGEEQGERAELHEQRVQGHPPARQDVEVVRGGLPLGQVGGPGDAGGEPDGQVGDRLRRSVPDRVDPVVGRVVLVAVLEEGVVEARPALGAPHPAVGVGVDETRLEQPLAEDRAVRPRGVARELDQPAVVLARLEEDGQSARADGLQVQEPADVLRPRVPGEGVGAGEADLLAAVEEVDDRAVVVLAGQLPGGLEHRADVDAVVGGTGALHRRVDVDVHQEGVLAVAGLAGDHVLDGVVDGAVVEAVRAGGALPLHLQTRDRLQLSGDEVEPLREPRARGDVRAEVLQTLGGGQGAPAGLPVGCRAGRPVRQREGDGQEQHQDRPGAGEPSRAGPCRRGVLRRPHGRRRVGRARPGLQHAHRRALSSVIPRAAAAAAVPATTCAVR